MIHVRVLYSGDVQGVGFRARARRIAGGHAVAGFVKNLPDGRVELAAEGERDAVRAFLDDVADELGGHVREATQTERSPQGLADFRIER